MQDPDPRSPLLPAPLLRAAKTLLGVLASTIAVAGGVITFGVAGTELVHAVGALFQQAPNACEQAIVLVVKSIDAVLLGLVQFLLAAYLWQILDPNESLVDEENMLRLEETKQILCKVVLVIVAVRMLSVLITPAELRWEHMVFPAGILALAFATTSLAKGGKNS